MKLALPGICLVGTAGICAAQTPAKVVVPSAKKAALPVATPSVPDAGFGKTKDSAVTLRYAVFVHGIHVMDAEGAYVLRPWGYGGKARLYTIGLASWFLNINIYAETQGHFDDKGWAEPLEYDSHGLSRKKNVMPISSLIRTAHILLS